MPEILIFLLLGVGLSIFLRQRFGLSRRVVTGQRARTIGCLLMLPLPLTIVLGLCWFAPMLSQYGSAEAMQQAMLTDPSFDSTFALIELLSVVGCVSLAAWLMFSASASSATSEAAMPSGQALTLRQAAGYSHLSESQLMMLIRANAIEAQRSVDGYRIDAKALELWMYMERGVSQYNRRAYVEAIQDFTRALNINHKSAQAYAWRGLAFLRVGRAADGLQDIRYALAHSQDSEERRQFTQWLNAPTTIPQQITGRNPTTERVVTDWLAGVDTVDHEAEKAEPSLKEISAAVTDTPYALSPEDGNETLRS